MLQTGVVIKQTVEDKRKKRKKGKEREGKRGKGKEEREKETLMEKDCKIKKETIGIQKGDIDGLKNIEIDK